jgi:hypothetical protein
MIHNENTFLASAFFLRIFLICTVFFVLSTAVFSAPLKDDEVCEPGKDCTCVHVTCANDTTCQISFGTGSCHGPVKPIETGIFSPDYVVPVIIVVLILGIYLLIQRRKKTPKK